MNHNHTEIFELHHHALAAWCRYRRKCPAAPALLTIDHHTDNVTALHHWANGNEHRRKERLAAFDFRNDDVVETAIRDLRHDEQLDLAIECGVISSGAILAHAKSEESAQPGISSGIEVATARDWPPLLTLLNDDDLFRSFADSVLEDAYLAPLLAEIGFIPEENPGFILDLDFDAFLTRRALKPVHRDTLARLLRAAGLITISLERDWQRILRLDRDFTAEEQLDAWEKLTGEITSRG